MAAPLPRPGRPTRAPAVDLGPTHAVPVGGPRHVVGGWSGNQPTWAPVADGAHVRWGLAWAAAAAAVLAAGPLALAVGAAVSAALAAVSTLPARSVVPSQVAAAGAAAVPLAALFGPGGVTTALVLIMATALVAAHPVVIPRAAGPGPLGEYVGAVGSALVWGLAAASPVLAHQRGIGSSAGLVVLVAATDAGAYLVGVGARWRYEGIVAGALCGAVAGFALAVLNVFGAGLVATALVAATVVVLVPIGSALGHMLTTDGGAVPARHRRRLIGAAAGRLDSWLVAGPIAAAVVLAMP